MSENERKDEAAPERLPELEVVCPRCRGKGSVPLGYPDPRCSNCGGSGYIPTEFGQRVLELVRHNFLFRHVSDQD